MYERIDPRLHVINDRGVEVRAEIDSASIPETFIPIGWQSFSPKDSLNIAPCINCTWEALLAAKPEIRLNYWGAVKRDTSSIMLSKKILDSLGWIIHLK